MSRTFTLCFTLLVLAAFPAGALAQGGKKDAKDEPKAKKDAKGDPKAKKDGKDDGKGTVKILERTLEEWFQMLAEDKQPKKRQASLIVMELLGPRHPGVLTALVKSVQNDPSPEVRRAVAGLLGRMGEDAKSVIPALGEVIGKDKDGGVRESAVKALGGKMITYAKPVIPVLAEALKDPHQGTRFAAAEVLRLMGDEARAAMRELMDVVKDPKADRFTRASAVLIVSRFANESSAVIPALVKVFGEADAHPGVREAAADALGNFGKDSIDAAPALASVLKDEKAPLGLRRASAVALGKVGADAKTAWPAVKVALGDSDNTLRYQAIRVAGPLAKVEKEAVAALAARLQDDYVEAKLAAIQELGELGPVAKDAAPALDKVARNDVRDTIREAAAAALKKVQGNP